MPDNKVCFIGFGEAGQAIAAGLRDDGVGAIAAWDILFPEPKGEKLKRAADVIGVRCATSAADALRDADMIVSAVTAAASVDAALSVKPHLAGRPFFPRHQLRLARAQAGDREASRRRRALRRCRRRRADLSGAAPDAAPSRRAACRGDRASARRALDARERRRAGRRRRRGDQDGAQRDHERHRGADARMFPRRRPRRRGRRGRGLAQEQLSRPRLGEDRSLQPRTHGEPRRTPRRRDGRSRRQRCANSASSRS